MQGATRTPLISAMSPNADSQHLAKKAHRHARRDHHGGDATRGSSWAAFHLSTKEKVSKFARKIRANERHMANKLAEVQKRSPARVTLLVFQAMVESAETLSAEAD